MSSACVSVDEPMTTALTTASPKTCSALPTCAPYFCASSAAAAALTSTTYLSLTPGWRTRLPAWILPMRPAPNNATSVIVFSAISRFFDVEREPVRQRDEQRLAQADRARERAKREG